MSKKKIYKLGSEELIKLLIDKQLSKYKITYENVKGRKDAWYQEYTFDSKEEYLEWKQFCLDVLSKQVKPKLTKEMVIKEFNFFDLCYGLKCNFNCVERTEKETIIL